MPQVFVLMGSASDLEIMRPCCDILTSLNIDFSVFVASAHRTPDRVEKIIQDGEAAGVKVFICAAGMAAHLAGAVAARTTRPVIGIPVGGSSLAGMDALFSTVQMPSGFPVATVALNGAANAAWLAAQIIALSDGRLAKLICAKRDELAQAVIKVSRQVEEQYQENGITFV